MRRILFMDAAIELPKTKEITMNTKTLAKGFIVYTKESENAPITETHYAVLPSGKILYSEGHTLGCSTFGPKDSDDWGHSSLLPATAHFCGNYYV